MILGFALLFVLMDVTAEFGTTPNLKQIVIGRCFEYVTLANLNPRYNCEKIWQEFEMAVVRSSPCDVRVKDYQKMFQVITQTLPCGKLLFWSKTRDLMHSYVAVTGSFWTLEDTLLGFMFNDLIWCGQQERERGFDYQSCPKWSACLNHPVYSLWKQASQNFAMAACGNITVLLNGSIHHAFNKKSMFGSVELENLNPRMVTHVHIKVIYNLEGPFLESCTQGSILGLIEVFKKRGFHWTCTDNDLWLTQEGGTGKPRSLSQAGCR
ncbi:ADP-ribosyl cyclase/cyclic ADP-ribose hydrolase 1 [Sinocyclocheilus anshuiensis]|uniref:ADP-ribosyl cyclase/cyclic ADP-ribose hydrolase 1 n=1 Tax=Sinocyclocheilus anshuiensis TaxID=1608454 RepID=UPI0007B81198|nr:PREDICTED: ADP-ribosyl cyclase/cyclic ADP-ribose hydrolase 1-like [Sinocyclocheilus anshuiensis]